jgi:hypothetical protein
MGREEVRMFNQKALELIDSGNSVITAYERLATEGARNTSTRRAFLPKRTFPRWRRMPGLACKDDER